MIKKQDQKGGSKGRIKKEESKRRDQKGTTFPLFIYH